MQRRPISAHLSRVAGPVHPKLRNSLETALKRLVILAVICISLLIVIPLHAQQFDVAFGLGTVSSASASSASGDHTAQSLGGGVYPAFSGDFLLRHNFGVQGEVAWRAGQGDYLGVQPYRPILYDFNAIWVPRIGPRAAGELLAGIGAESIRFYTPFFNCNSFSCTNYTSSTHFMGDLGGGIRLYPYGHFFVRPEFRVYLIHNNVEFSSGHAVRYGASIGYTFGGR